MEWQQFHRHQPSTHVNRPHKHASKREVAAARHKASGRCGWQQRLGNTETAQGTSPQQQRQHAHMHKHKPTHTHPHAPTRTHTHREQNKQKTPSMRRYACSQTAKQRSSGCSCLKHDHTDAQRTDAQAHTELKTWCRRPRHRHRHHRQHQHRSH